MFIDIRASPMEDTSCAILNGRCRNTPKWFLICQRKSRPCGKSGRAALCFSLLLVWCAHDAHDFTIAGIRTARQMLTTRRWTRDLEAAASSCFKLLQLLWTACRLFDCALALSHPCLERKDLGEMKVSVEDYGSCCLLLGHVPKSMLPWPANWCCLCQDTHWQKWSASKCWRQPRWRTNTAAARGRRKLEHCKVTTALCLYISYLNIINYEDQRHVPIGTLM